MSPSWRTSPCKVCGVAVVHYKRTRALCDSCRTAEILAQPERDDEPAFSPLWPSMVRR